VIEQDMIAVPVTGDQREAVVAAPAYVAANGAPAHPRDLVHHRCIGWRPALNVAPHRWEFEEKGVAFDVAVEVPAAGSTDVSAVATLEPAESPRIHAVACRHRDGGRYREPGSFAGRPKGNGVGNRIVAIQILDALQ
jgi:hypothetical protein